ncbi:MAG TPA: NYN domain-containing protein [Anaerolineaceae bacterium]
MTYLVDGHNLIPHVPGLRLDQIDDEKALIHLLQQFSQARRKPVEVYFDGALPAQPLTQKNGSVVAHFVRKGSTADTAILQRLLKLGKAARNVIVVSSDAHVRTNARHFQAQVISSEQFARILLETPASKTSSFADQGKLSQEEVESWMEIFRKR